jgi:hypothetical protein
MANVMFAAVIACILCCSAFAVEIPKEWELIGTPDPSEMVKSY